jgi:hypothetical protein
MRSIHQTIIPLSKTPMKTPMRIGPRGGRLKGGNLGNKGGCKPDEFKALCRELVSSTKTVENVQAILMNANHPHFMAVLKWASEHGYGRPTATIELQHGVVILPAVKSA